MMTPKQQRVLDALTQFNEPVDLPSLIQYLGEDFTDRTLRRWLSDWSENGRIIKTGNKRSTRYQLNQQRPTTSSFSPKSLGVIQEVREPLFNRMPKSYNEKWVNNYHSQNMSYFSADELNEMYEQGRRTAMPEQAGTYARKILNRLLIDLSYNSSRLEGNTYSLVDTEKLVLEGAPAADKLDEETVMVLNHKEAIRHLVEFSSRVEVNFDEVCTLHYLLSDGLVPNEYSGKMRDHSLRIGASTYVPIENSKRLEKCLNKICQVAENINNPHEKSLFLLAQIAYLQAFTDVNKRTSRLSANIPLIKQNLVPLSFNDIDKDDYASAMIAIYEFNNIRPLAELYHFSYLRTCRLYDATAESLGFDAVRVQYRAERRAIIREIILQKLHANTLEKFVTEKSEQISTADRSDFIEDIKEDLEELSPQRLAGLGVTRDELSEWLREE